MDGIRHDGKEDRKKCNRHTCRRVKPCFPHMGGKADVAAISSKGQLELADILPTLETGQMLNFIEVKSGDVSITEKDIQRILQLDLL